MNKNLTQTMHLSMDNNQRLLHNIIASSLFFGRIYFRSWQVFYCLNYRINPAFQKKCRVFYFY